MKIDYESLLLLQPEHTKELIPNINDRIKFDAIFFRSVESEKKENGNGNDGLSTEYEAPTDETQQMLEITTDDIFHDDELEYEAQSIESPPIRQKTSGITEDDESGNCQTVERDDNCAVLHEHKDLFDLMNIIDFDYDIVLAKYKNENVLSAGDRNTLSKCVVKHTLKNNIQR